VCLSIAVSLLVSRVFSVIAAYNETSEAVCQKLVNMTIGYPKDVVQCQVNAVLNSTYRDVATSTPYTTTYQGQLWWPLYGWAPSGIQGIARQSRDAFLQSAKAPSSDVTINSTCSETYSFYEVPQNIPLRRRALRQSQTDPRSGVLTVPGLPLTRCRVTVKGAPSVDTSEACKDTPSLCLQNISPSTVGQVGIDNGKFCPDGTSAIVSGSVGAGSLSGVAAVPYDPATDTITVTPTTMPAGYQAGVSLKPGQSVVRLYSFAIAAPYPPGTETCRFQSINFGTVYYTGADAVTQYVRSSNLAVIQATSTSITLSLDLNSALGCSFASTAVFAVPAGSPNLQVYGAWSPSCDTSYSYYYQFATGSAGVLGANVFGNVCPRCGPTASPKLFQYNSTVAGSFCVNPTIWDTSVVTGSSCVKVGVADYGPGSYRTGKAMLAANFARTLPAFGTEAIFPTLPQGAVLPFDSSSISVTVGNQLTSKTVFSWIAMDTQYGVPCSSPRLQWTSPTVGISVPSFSFSYRCDSSQFVTRAPINSDMPLCGAGSCNTESAFFNGGTGTSGNRIPPDMYSAAILSTQFLAGNYTESAAVPAPVPAPEPAPVPAPEPAPVCRYDGEYTIAAAGCPTGVLIASPSSYECASNVVELRTAQQVYPKPQRIRWKIAGDGRVVAVARVPACIPGSNLAGKDGSNRIKVGGRDWRWEIRPTASCDEVMLVSLNRTVGADVLSPTANCDAFEWNQEGRWTLTKL
jgi:hypothetical protein